MHSFSVDLISDLSARFPVGASVRDTDSGCEGIVVDHSVYLGEHVPYRVVCVDFSDCYREYSEHALFSLELSDAIEERYAANRVRLPSTFTLDVINASCVGCVEIAGVRNIVWEYEGSKYLQECRSNKSVFYTVH